MPGVGLHGANGNEVAAVRFSFSGVLVDCASHILVLGAFQAAVVSERISNLDGQSVWHGGGLEDGLESLSELVSHVPAEIDHTHDSSISVNAIGKMNLMLSPAS